MASADRLEPAAFAVLERTNEALARHHMVDFEDTVVVGVSGGPDSTCLLDVLRRARFGLKLVVAHVDHGLSEASDKVARARRCGRVDGRARRAPGSSLGPRWPQPPGARS